MSPGRKRQVMETYGCSGLPKSAGFLLSPKKGGQTDHLDNLFCDSEQTRRNTHTHTRLRTNKKQTILNAKGNKHEKAEAKPRTPNTGFTFSLLAFPFLNPWKTNSETSPRHIRQRAGRALRRKARCRPPSSANPPPRPSAAEASGRGDGSERAKRGR